MSVRNILATYYQATELEQVEGLRWYQTAHAWAAAVARRYGIPTAVAAGVVAALSPSVSWEINLRDAETLIDAWYHGIPAEAVTVSTYTNNKVKAYRILQRGSIDGAFNPATGPKTWAFADNILHPETSDAVTVDRHAYACWLGRVPESCPTLTGKRYQQIADDYRAAAAHLGIRPCQLQAICWLAWKRRKAQA